LDLVCAVSPHSNLGSVNPSMPNRNQSCPTGEALARRKSTQTYILNRVYAPTHRDLLFIYTANLRPYKASSHPSGNAQETHAYASHEIRTGYVQNMIQASHSAEVFGDKYFIQSV
jgi:hypothetical protein